MSLRDQIVSEPAAKPKAKKPPKNDGLVKLAKKAAAKPPVPLSERPYWVGGPDDPDSPKPRKATGRPPSGRIRIHIYLNPATVERWRATGQNWQRRLSDALDTLEPKAEGDA